jgi:hypothetical protein
VVESLHNVTYRASIVSLLAAIALVAAASDGPRGALAADTPPSAEQSYFDTLAVMHAIPNAPFLRFDYRFAQVASNMADHQEDWHAVERTEDGRVRFKDDRGEDRPAHRRPFSYIRLDLFLKPVPAAANEFAIVTDTPYKVIGSTRTQTTHYTITDASADAAAECPGAMHLRLRPKVGADPFYYNLRELWVTTASGRICKAVAVWNGLMFMGHRSAVEVTLDVNAETGLIDRSSTAGIAHSGPFQTRYRITGRYTNVTAESSAPAGFFDR